MPAISDRRPAINRRHWLYRNIVGLWVPISGGRVLANLAAPGQAESRLQSKGNAGRHRADTLLAGDTVSSGSYSYSGGYLTPPMLVPVPYSLGWFGDVYGVRSGNYNRIFGLEDPIGLDKSIEFQRHDTDGQVNFHFEDASFNGPEAIVTSSFATGRRQSLCASMRAGASSPYCFTWYNGIAGATSNNVAFSQMTTASEVVIGAIDGSVTTGYTNTGMHVGLFVNRELSATEWRKLHVDPSQLYVQPWRLPKFIALGSTGTAQALAGTIAATSAVTAALTVAHPLAATVAAVSTVTAALTVPAPTGPVDAFTGTYAAAWTTVGGGCTIVGDRSRQEMAAVHSLISSDYIYTFDDSIGFVEVELDADPDRYVYYYWHNAASSAGFYVLVQNADLIFSVTGQTDFTVTYNAVSHRWWRVREANGDLFFDTSADGLAWTQQVTRPAHGLTLTSLRLDLGAADLAAGSGSYAYFDNVNVLPGVALAGTINATTAATGALTVAHPLAATIAATSTVTAALTVQHPLAATVAATSTVTAALTVAHPLAATIAATSALTGDLAATHTLASIVAATSTVTAALSVVHPLAATVAAQTTMAGDLAVTHPLAATVTSISTVTGDLAATHPLAASVAVVSTVTGDLTTSSQVTLTGTIAATSTVTGDLAVTHPLAATVGATSALTGDLIVAHALAATVAGQSTIAGAMVALLTLAGRVDAVLSMVGSLTVAGEVTTFGPRARHDEYSRASHTEVSRGRHDEHTRGVDQEGT